MDTFRVRMHCWGCACLGDDRCRGYRLCYDFRRSTNRQEDMIQTLGNDSDTLKAMEKIARKWRKKICLHVNAPLSMGDLERISKRRKAKIRISWSLYDGRIMTDGRGFDIQLCFDRISDRDLYMTARFVLAHELAHTCFYTFSTISGNNSQRPERSFNNSYIEERICDWLARALLMPLKGMKWLMRYLGYKKTSGWFNHTTIIAFSQYFQVLPEQVVARCLNLGWKYIES